MEKNTAHTADVTQEGINNYILGILHMPLASRKQIDAMVILHFDLPDAKAHDMVSVALTHALQVYNERWRDLSRQLMHTTDGIQRINKWRA